ncbi:GGDEF domain-containing protein, partial [Vibrio cholerae]
MSQSKNGMPLPHFMSIGSVPDTEGKAAHYVYVMTDLTRVKQAEERLDALTYLDPLTGLPNRTLIWLRLEQAVAQAQ